MNRKIIFAGIKRNPGRTFEISFVVFVLSLVLFFGSYMIVSISNGIQSLSDRLGADIMVVPLGYESSATDILIKGEPSYFYFDSDISEEIRGIAGVEQASPQFYLTSSNQGCCDIPVQFIGIDEDTDFSVLPWIKDVYSKGESLGDRRIVVGSDIDVPEDRTIRFFDEYFEVTAQLDETGTGLDQAVFANRETTRLLYEAAGKKGFNFTGSVDVDNSVSSIMIKTVKGYTTEEVTHNLRVAFDGLQIIETKDMTNSLETSLKGFVSLLYVLVVILLLLSYVILSLVFRLTFNERKREYALMKMAGATQKSICGLVIKEAFIESLGGAASGIIFTLLIILPFKIAINSAIKLPYLEPGALTLFAIIIVVFLVGSITGPVAALGTAIKAGKIELYEAKKVS
ncbi:MAG: ABC transporter permease [Butyrivibrio sp.]|nr:ABC transporter permease [Butyrivibrio sp.]